MSHYNKLKTELRNRPNLIKALAKMGFGEGKIEIHDEADYLVGYQGDKREQKANIILRRKHVGGASNDIGFELQTDGTYVAHISDYDKSRYNDNWMKNLELHYGEEQAKTAFANEGWSCIESMDEQGNVQLVGTRMGGF